MGARWDIVLDTMHDITHVVLGGRSRIVQIAK